MRKKCFLLKENNYFCKENRVFLHPLKSMEHHISQEETRRIIISDMVKKRHSIVPIIGEDTCFFGVPLVFLGLFYRVLKWICRTLHEGSKVTRRYMLIMNRSSLAHEAGFVVPRTYVREAVNVCSLILSP